MGSGWKFEVIRKTMDEADNQLGVSMLCEIAGVSRSGYYRWVNAAEVREEREKKDRGDFGLVRKAYNQRGYSKGARGIYMCMVHWEPPVVMNVKKIRRLMDKYGLVCPIRKATPYRRMAKALKTGNVRIGSPRNGAAEIYGIVRKTIIILNIFAIWTHHFATF